MMDNAFGEYMGGCFDRNITCSKEKYMSTTHVYASEDKVKSFP